MKESTVPTTLQIGQHGATEAIVEELRAQVRSKRVVKAKRLRTAEVADEKTFWRELADRAGVRLLEVRGHTAVFADPKYKTEREQKRV